MGTAGCASLNPALTSGYMSCRRALMPAVNLTARRSIAELLIQRGDAPDTAALGVLGRRLADGTTPAAENVDLSVYDIFTTVNTVTGEIA